MVPSAAVWGYGPFELVTEPAVLDLVTTTATSSLGSCVARHPAERRSPRATLFLHGAAGSWTTWTPMLLAARELGIELGDTVLLDLPGWGSAELSKEADGHTVDAISSLVKAIAEQLGYTEWDIVGHSLGGFVALHMAAVWPEAVLSVGMVSGTTFSVIESVAHPVSRFFEIPGFTLLWRVMQFLAAIGPAGPRLVRRLFAIGLLRPLTFPLFRHWRRVPRSQAAALAVELRPHSFVAAANATRGYDAEGLWDRISCPVRASRGDRDVFVTARDLERLGDVVPHSVRTTVADCGHFGNVERPAATLAALGFVP
jgi:pimeloyl-ACP methyl ester carboxylesterase